MRSFAVTVLGTVSLLAGCLGTNVIYCENGAICPASHACTEQESLCGPEDRVNACFGAGKQEFDECDFAPGQQGTCHAGICDACNPELAGCYDDQWLPMTSGIGEDLTAVWVAGISEAYAVGDRGVALHYDGFTWQHLADLEAIANGARLVAIWGVTDPLQMFALAADGKVFRYEDTWSSDTPPSLRPLTTIGMTARDQLIGAGARGEIWRLDSGGWSELVAASSSTLTYWGVWGTGPTDVYAVGQDLNNLDGVVRHYDGISWSPSHTASAQEFRAIWGSGSTDVFAVGPGAPVAHFNGSWVSLPLGIATGTAVWGSGPGDVFVVGPNGVYHYDGSAPPTVSSTWTRMGMMSLASVAGSSRRNVIAVGPAGSIWRYAPN